MKTRHLLLLACAATVLGASAVEPTSNSPVVALRFVSAAGAFTAVQQKLGTNAAEAVSGVDEKRNTVALDSAHSQAVVVRAFLTGLDHQPPEVHAVVPASYSTEATMTPRKDKGTYEVVVRVSQLVEQDGKLTETLVAQPKVTGPLGVPASMYSGLQPTQANYQKEENVTVDVSWPKPGQSGVAFCTVTVKRGDKVVSKSKLQVTVEDK